jgi:hypothetical protein
MFPNDPKALVFGSGRIKRAYEVWNDRRVRDQWDAVCGMADIDDLQLRDTRHTFATRYVSIIPLGELLKMTRHYGKDAVTTLMRYINPAQDSFDRNATAVENLIAAQSERPLQSAQVN